MLSRTPNWPPDYTQLLVWRQQQLMLMQQKPELILGAKEYYRVRPGAFISHWCDTYDPRNAGTDKATRIPFVLFPRQYELLQFIVACAKGQAGGLIEKSRDMGATWLCCAFSVHQWLFEPGFTAGWGSRKAELVDELGVLDSIFEKMRYIIRGLPSFFLPKGFVPRDNMMYMRILNPENGNSITGEVGDNIGRGGRKSIYFKDESAHYEHPESIEAALSETTRVQIDMSSVNGHNVFQRKRDAGVDWASGHKVTRGHTNVFVLDWRDHPEKDQAWYDLKKQQAVDEGLLHVFYQEVDRNYSASVEGIIIQPEWVRASFDAHKRIKGMDDGAWVSALDVADGGGDRNAQSKRKGVVLKFLAEWGERDTAHTARRAIDNCGDDTRELHYDSVGVGSGVKAETNRLADDRLLPKGLRIFPWNAGEGPLHPDKHVIPADRQSPLNKDLFLNLKAQGWWLLGRRFEKTWRVMQALAANEPLPNYSPDELISIDTSTIPVHLLRKLEKELCQPVMVRSARMKMMVDKMPEGVRSPNLGDTTMMNYHPAKTSTYDSSLSWV